MTTPCFPGGSGRELIAEDVIFSIKRMANLKLRPKGWWIYTTASPASTHTKTVNVIDRLGPL